MEREIHFKLKVSDEHLPEDVEHAIEAEAEDVFGSALEPDVVELQDNLWAVMLCFEGTDLEREEPEYLAESAEEFMDAVVYHLEDASWIQVELDDDDDLLTDDFYEPIEV